MRRMELFDDKVFDYTVQDDTESSLLTSHQAEYKYYHRSRFGDSNDGKAQFLTYLWYTSRQRQKEKRYRGQIKNRMWILSDERKW